MPNISLCTGKGLSNGNQPVESRERVREFRVNCRYSAVLFDAQMRCYAVPPGRSRLKRFAYNQVVIANWREPIPSALRSQCRRLWERQCS
jgi:hypothetical protein